MKIPLAITLHNENLLREIKTPCKISGAFDPQKDPPMPMKEYTAIWDTGATNSVVSSKVVQELGLKATGKERVYTASSKEGIIADTYFVNICLPNGVLITLVRVIEGATSGADALIGMDVITLGDFTISNYQGKTTMSFRIPSIENTDYVQEIDEYKKYLKIYKEQSKHGNEKCPCHSGKLYKNCHGKSKYAT